MSEAPKRPRLRPSPRKAASAPTTPDPIEIAMEAEAGDTSPDSPARMLLVNQNRLVRWQIASERAGFALRMLTMLVGVVIAGLLGLLAWQASQAKGVVVEAFSVPPSLAQQGLTGDVVAEDILGQLGRLNQTAFDPEALQISDGWSANSRVEIPRTGVSLDEIDRLLRRRLGHETHIRGAIVQTPNGVAISAHADGHDMVRVEGPVADLPRLSQEVAEQLLRTARPVRYARLLLIRGEGELAVALLRDVLATSTDARLVGEAHSQLGLIYQVQGRLGSARAEALAGLRSTGHMGAYRTLGFVERGFGRDARSVEAMEQYAKRIRQARELAPLRRERIYTTTRAYIALVRGDFTTARRLFEEGAGNALESNLSALGYENVARALVGLHEPQAVRRLLPLIQASSPLRANAFFAALSTLAAADEGDWTGVIRALDEAKAPPTPGMLGAPTPDAFRALALAKLGRVAEAQALAARLPGDCYRCLRTRAEVAEAAGDQADADRFLAEALRQNPRLPFAETDWARLLLARGDTAGALAKARAAAAKQPAFADPLEVWGETLLAKGDAGAAAAKFAEAQPFAPRWGRLHLKWGEALAKLGKADAARAKWRAAATMDLSAADRAALKAHGV